MLRIDTHHHAVPTDYRNLLHKKGIDAGGRAIPAWSPEGSLQTMAALGVWTAMLSVSTPGTTFLPNPADAAASDEVIAGELAKAQAKVRADAEAKAKAAAEAKAKAAAAAAPAPAPAG